MYHNVVLRRKPPVYLDNTPTSCYTPYRCMPALRGVIPETAAPSDALRTAQIELALPPPQIRRRPPGILDAGKVRGCRFRFRAPCPSRLRSPARRIPLPLPGRRSRDRRRVDGLGDFLPRPHSSPSPVPAGSQGQQTGLDVCVRALSVADFLGTAHLAAQPGSTACAHLEERSAAKVSIA